LPGQPLDPAQYVGINSRVSQFIALGRQHPVAINFSGARCAPALYPGEALKNAATRALRRDPELLVKVSPHNGNPGFRSILAKRAMASGMLIAPEDVVVTQGCIEALNLLRAVTQPGDIVAMSPCHGLLQPKVRRALEIPTSPQTGISIEALELATQTCGPIRRWCCPHPQITRQHHARTSRPPGSSFCYQNIP
jgi:DNA-binding transcriptional MocR family regulator